MEIQQEPEWQKAATLAERAAQRGYGGCDATRPTDMARGQRRLARWKEQPPFDTGDYFARRLAMEEMNEEDLLRLLAEETCGTNSANSRWLEDLAHSYDEAPSPAILRNYDLPFLRENAGFLAVVQPVIDQALRRLRADISNMETPGTVLPFRADAVPAMLVNHLAMRLLAILDPTMILELNVARVEGNLHGDSPEKRFASFLIRLQNRDASLSILREYPVLARQIMIRASQWATCSLEFLRALCKDWAAIRAMFSPQNDPGALLEVRGGVGDYHRKGRSVLICKFSSGLKLVYKPRPLSLDRHFQELLNWMNSRSRLRFRTLKILERGEYGWVEFVETAACESREEVERFYERQGGYLALLFALEASDFHYENVIAAGEHPVLIDLEALFHPRIESGTEQESDEAIAGSMSYSVLRVGLLPQRLFGADGSPGTSGVDLSGMGGIGGQLTQEPVQWLEETGTDTMYVGRRHLAIPGRENRPSLAHAEIRVQDYAEALVGGFTAVYETMLENREELLSANGPLAEFAGDRIRAVVRPTEVYALLLRESFHPGWLRDALDRDRFLDHLWAAVRECPVLEKVISSERDSLLQGDIPIFTTRPSSCDLWSGDNQVFPNFLPASGLDRVRKRLLWLSQDDLARQVWFIRASLTSLTLGEAMEVRRPNRRSLGPGEPVSPEQLVAAAAKVGDRLMELALWSKDDVSWVGIGLVNDQAWSVLPLGGKLYDGLPGIILFLAYLDSIAPRGNYARAARTALRSLLRQLKQLPEVKIIGGFSGLGGILYLLCHLSVLWNLDELLEECEKIVEMLPALIEHDDNLDLIAGAAGCLAALLVFHCLRPSKRVLSVAMECGDHLVRRARPVDEGGGWLVSSMAPVPLTGFSHGAAGIAWVLTELGSLTGEERFQQAAMQGVAYERNLFDPELGNWPDLRREPASDSESESIHCGTMWCHGAPGIALGRLKMLKHINRQDVREEAEIALRTTLETGFGLNHCLCHGDLGNLESVLQASLIFTEAPLWKEEAGRIVASVLESIQHDGWLCGTPAHVETPGLMTGISGIGFQLLRLAYPMRVPSVLCFEPPVGAASHKAAQVKNEAKMFTGTQ